MNDVSVLLYRDLEGSTLKLVDILGDHVKALNLDCSPESPHQSITVRRRHIWNDVQRCVRKTYTNLKLPIRIVFVGEPAEDQGGPRREFFRLSLGAATSDGTLFSVIAMFLFTVPVLSYTRAFCMQGG